MMRTDSTSEAARGSDDVRRSRRLRARRLTLEQLQLSHLRARMDHPELGTLEGSVEDLSLHGARIRFGGRVKVSPYLLVAQRIDRFRLDYQGEILHEGSAVISRCQENADDLVVGVEIQDGGVDLRTLHKLGEREGLRARWADVTRAADHGDCSEAFRAWLIDIRSYLEVVQSFLDAEEHRAHLEDQLTREEILRELLDTCAPDIIAKMNQYSHRLGEIVRDFSDEDHVRTRMFCRHHLAPLLSYSPFMARSLEKPLGYAGDYEMMNMLYRPHAEGPSVFGKALNLYATQEAASQANINRLEYLGEKIRRLVEQSPREGRVHIASVGSGPAEEVRTLLRESPQLGKQLEISLIDQEERAISWCERTLASLAQETGVRFRFIRERIRRLLVAGDLSAALGKCSLIYSSGLFDYLGDRSFGALLKALYPAVLPGGQIIVGNVASENPSRWVMEYFLEWFLNHRSEQDLLHLADALDPAPYSRRVEAEPSGVNLFLVIEK